ncbi:MAG: IS110 family transposase, partial [Hyphomonadaceae bacterium]|nr:IS110 family transposase [Hyphomonadaceae bacterium]
DRLVSNAKPKMVALNALMRKLITQLNAMMRDQTDWAKNTSS